MARQRSPNRDKAFELFKEHNGNITNRKIAEILNEDEKIVAVWKQRDKWIVVQQSDESCTTNKSKVGAPKSNKNAVGNPGNRNPKFGNKNAVGHGAPANNKNAVTHGLYATVVYEHLSDEDRRLFDLSQDIEGQEQELQVARFKLAKLMQDQKEHRLKGMAITGDGAYSYTLRDDFYTDAINKALDMISKIETRIHKAQTEREKLELQKIEHEKKLDLMQAQIEKVKADTARIKGEDGEEYEDDGFKEALEGKVEEVWDDHDDDTKA